MNATPKYWGATAQAWADCNILGVCGKVGEAAIHTPLKWSQGNCHASHYQRRECRIQRHDGNYQCCSELRTRGRKAGGASRWQESAAGQARGQAGRHAAEQAAKEAAQTFGIEVTKVTAKGVEVVASMGSPAATSKGAEVAMQEGTRMATEGAGGWLQSAIAYVGPAVGGAFNAGFEAYNNGITPKVGSKFASGAAGNLAGGVLGAACGPMAWACVPIAAVAATKVLDSFVVDTLHAEVITREEEEQLQQAFKVAVHQQKSVAS